MGHFDNHLEAEFSKVSMIDALKGRHSVGDINGLLEYALLVVEDNHCSKLRLKFLENELKSFIMDGLKQNLPPVNKTVEPG
jgi:hypothetical protein